MRVLALYCSLNHKISYLFLLEVPKSDDILMNPCKAIVQTNTRSNAAKGIAVSWGVVNGE